MRTRTFVSTGAFASTSLREVLALCEQDGFLSIELSSGLAYESAQLDHVRASAGRFNFLIHNYFPPPQDPFLLNPASLDDTNLARVVHHCERAVDLCSELEIDFFSMHSGFGAEPLPDRLGRPLVDYVHDDLESSYKTCLQTVGQLADYAQTRGARVLIENHPIAPFNVQRGRDPFLFASTPLDIERFFDDLAHDNVGLLLDVGHLHVTATTMGASPSEWMKSLIPYAEALHLSHNDGASDTNDPFDHSAWFVPLLADLADLPIVLEIYGQDPSDIRACLSVVNEAIG